MTDRVTMVSSINLDVQSPRAESFQIQDTVTKYNQHDENLKDRRSSEESGHQKYNDKLHESQHESVERGSMDTGFFLHSQAEDEEIINNAAVCYKETFAVQESREGFLPSLHTDNSLTDLHFPVGVDSRRDLKDNTAINLSINSIGYIHVPQEESVEPSDESNDFQNILPAPGANGWQKLVKELHQEIDLLLRSNQKQSSTIGKLTEENARMKRMLDEAGSLEMMNEQVKTYERDFNIERNEKQLAQAEVLSLRQQLKTMHEQQRIAKEKIEELEARLYQPPQTNIRDLPGLSYVGIQEGSERRSHESKQMTDLENDSVIIKRSL